MNPSYEHLCKPHHLSKYSRHKVLQHGTGCFINTSSYSAVAPSVINRVSNKLFITYLVGFKFGESCQTRTTKKSQLAATCIYNKDNLGHCLLTFKVLVNS
jgi:hypothetical protein